MRKVVFQDLGELAYKKAWDYQTKLFKTVIDRKVKNRQLADQKKIPQTSYLLFCEHPHVYTLGRNGKETHLLLDQNELEQKDASFIKINRGGDITYHGKGQIVGYPILDLDEFFTDIGRYIRLLEEIVIQTLAEYSIIAGRISGESGVWIDEATSQARKICAVGVHLSRWVTMHGFAFNINTNLDYFNHIVPCGIQDKGVTSLAKELGHAVDLKEVKSKLIRHFTDLFDADLTASLAD